MWIVLLSDNPAWQTSAVHLGGQFRLQQLGVQNACAVRLQALACCSVHLLPPVCRWRAVREADGKRRPDTSSEW